MVNDCEMTLARDGGKGYNVVATLPGSVKGAGRIVIGAHHDAYFHAGLDDTGGVTCGMLMAKAMKLSGYRNARDITFLFTHRRGVRGHRRLLRLAHRRLARHHPAASGLGGPHRPHAQPRVHGAERRHHGDEGDAGGEVPHRRRRGGASRRSCPNGYNIKNVNCWNDQWTFTAAGVPSMYFRARTGEYGCKWYHTNFDTIDLMDYDYLAGINKLVFGIAKQFDRGLLPYDLTARAADLDDNVDGAALKADGASAAKVDRLEAAIARFANRAAALKARSAHIPAYRRAAANDLLMQVEKRINKAFTALDVWDTTAYPHAQVQWDLEQLNAALAGLAAAPVDDAAVLDSLKGVGITAPYALDFSYENYLMQLATHQPGWQGGLFWGAQGHLSPYLDVVPTMQKVDDGNYAAASASLSVMRTSEVNQLNDRLDAMSRALEGVNAVLPSIR